MDLKTRVKGSVIFSELENTDSKKEIRYVCEDGFEFPVPLEDTKGTVFKISDKGIFFMRWIKAHMLAIGGRGNEH